MYYAQQCITITNNLAHLVVMASVPTALLLLVLLNQVPTQLSNIAPLFLSSGGMGNL